MVDEKSLIRKSAKRVSRRTKREYGKLSRLLWGAAKQEKRSQGVGSQKPRALNRTANSKNSPLSLASTQQTIEGWRRRIERSPD
jgi:hypothetical protein